MDYYLLVADERLLRDVFADLLSPNPAMHEAEWKDPFTCKVSRGMVPVASVDDELLMQNSWQIGSPTTLIELALACTVREAEAELTPVRMTDGWSLFAVSETATRAIASAGPERLDGYEIQLQPGQRLYVYWDG